MRTTRFLCLSASLGFLLFGCAGPTIPDKKFAIETLKVDPETARELVNVYRRAHGLSAVTVDTTLQKVAQTQANAMASAGLLSHEVEGSLSKRLDRARVPQGAAVENVSAGYDSLPRVFAGWQHSPSHNANLLDPAMHRMGIASAYGEGTRFKTFWALVMTD
jgi:uncharacterized protein YkwD